MLPIALLLASAALPQERLLIEVHDQNEDVYCDVRAEDAPVHLVMQRLCRELDLELTGFEDVNESKTVNVYLRNRPLEVTVDYVLGAAGLAGTLSATGIDVYSANPPFPTRGELLQNAEIGLLELLQRFPEGVRAVEARQELARIAVLRGELEKAAHHYELLVEVTASSPAQTATRMKAGRLLVELQEWSRAARHFRHVAESEPEVHVGAEARRELARCTLMRGESARALHMLRALEHLVAPMDEEDAAIRLLLLARAEVEQNRPMDALRNLDRARRIGPSYVDELEVMDLRARALELQDKPVEAALAWLHFSRNQGENLKREALIRAAQIALAQEGEELALVFLHKHAENEGLGDALLPFVNEARARLGLQEKSYIEASPSARLLRAVQLINAGSEEAAARAFASLSSRLNDLSAEERVLLATSYAPLLERQRGVMEAIDLLRLVAPTLEAVENRTHLYLLAGEIYERNQRFEEAAEAYGGRL